MVEKKCSAVAQYFLTVAEWNNHTHMSSGYPGFDWDFGQVEQQRAAWALKKHHCMKQKIITKKGRKRKLRPRHHRPRPTSSVPIKNCLKVHVDPKREYDFLSFTDIDFRALGQLTKQLFGYLIYSSKKRSYFYNRCSLYCWLNSSSICIVAFLNWICKIKLRLSLNYTVCFYKISVDRKSNFTPFPKKVNKSLQKLHCGQQQGVSACHWAFFSLHLI